MTRTLTMVFALLGTLAGPLAASPPPTVPPTRLDDADLVLVLPAMSRRDEHQMIRLLRPWAQRVQPLAISYVSLQDITTDTGMSLVTAEDVRHYLRSRFTPRATTLERPRYLGIVALPYAEYGDATEPVQLPIIPRFTVQVRGVEPQYTQIETDVPYGFLLPETIDGSDGFVDPRDLDMATETFTVFRIPISQVGDLEHFVSRANGFAGAAYRSDVALVAGEFGMFLGDTSVIQCLNANGLSGIAGRVFKIFDTTLVCSPDFLVTGPEHRLAQFLADSTDGFHGGMIYDVSHGNFDAIYAQPPGSSFLIPNLTREDLGNLADGELNVFVSISCDNDEHAPQTNLAMDMYLHNSVAVVSATATLFPLSIASILDAEVNAFLSLYTQPLTLLQALHGFRAMYYRKYVIDGSDADPHHWINLLAIHVVGDGLAVVAR